MNILVTGGAGYIGSHAVKTLLKNKHKVIIFDNLSTGNKKLLNSKVKFYKGDLTNSKDIEKTFKKEKIDTVMHFAAFSQVGESFMDPQKYFYNNVYGSLNLFNAMLKANIKKIIFSSTAAVYGEPIKIPITETHPLNPVNPYGISKKIIEEILKEYDKSYGLKSICLRYFNAGGASKDHDIGEMHNPETHLIPLVLKTAKGERKQIEIFGTAWSTKDGTCIRDYVHVEDIIDAHILALNYLQKKNTSDVFNLGTNRGYSVKEIIQKCKDVTKIDFKVEKSERRKGDPETLVASNAKAKKILGWEPKRTLHEIIESAWDWEKSNNQSPKSN
jgi:UDP-glucose 4-epimerase